MEDSREQRIRWLLALEIRRIVTGLELRRDYLATLWSRHRAREPYLETLASRWGSLGFDHLVELESSAIVSLEAFYETLGDVRLYCQYTEDMPATMLDAMDAFREQLHELGEAALAAIGVDEVTLPPAPERRE
jgi:hypothetical protein